MYVIEKLRLQKKPVSPALTPDGTEHLSLHGDPVSLRTVSDIRADREKHYGGDTPLCDCFYLFVCLFLRKGKIKASLQDCFFFFSLNCVRFTFPMESLEKPWGQRELWGGWPTHKRSPLASPCEAVDIPRLSHREASEDATHRPL